MTNLVYQTAVQELEAVLSPRVVSRSLKEGLRQFGSTPETVDVDTLEQILKGHVYRQLQVTMPVTEAKSTVAVILERLREVGASGAPAAPSAGDAQSERLQRLQQALKPYNLYFEWPEVQKLRAQLQLLEAELEAGREAGALLADAESQLQLIAQKLEDQLVLQAREVAELSEALELVRGLGGPKVRRLESLVNHMRAAQEARQLAPAELERARKLARDLRKLVESSAYPDAVRDDDGAGVPAAPAADDAADDEEALEIDVDSLSPEASERLRQIDLAAERQELGALRGDSAALLAYRPELEERFDALLARVDAGESVAADLTALREDLATASAEVRDALRAELAELAREVESLPAGLDTAELRQATRVTLGILATTLPEAADVEHVRQLRDLAREQAEAQRRAEEALAAQLAAQEELVRRLEGTLVRYESHGPAEDVRRLREEIESLRRAQESRTLAPDVAASARQAEERLARDLAERATEESERRRARIESLRARLTAVPVTATLTERVTSALREVDRLLAADDASALLIDGSPAAGSADLEALEALVTALRSEAVVSVRRRLEAMAERAGELGSVPLSERLQGAIAGLSSGVFPDLGGLEADLQRAVEASRTRQLGELHRLTREAETYDGFDDPALKQLLELLATERRQLAEGGLARRLGEAAALLAGVEARFEERIAAMPTRLDAALQRFQVVAKLNSDDVAAVRRILEHLDSQRESLPRVSVGLKLQLEASLTKAEQLLASLEEEFEATRVIADQLVLGGLLDDVFGALGGPAQAPVHRAVDPAELAERYAETPGVTAVAVYSSAGQLLAGSALAGAAALPALRQAAASLLSAEGDVLVVTAGLSESHVVAAFAAELAVALTVDSAALAPVVSGRLRRDLGGD